MIEIALAKPRPRLRKLLRRLLPKRLTLSHNPAIYGWLWWNLGFKPDPLDVEVRSCILMRKQLNGDLCYAGCIDSTGPHWCANLAEAYMDKGLTLIYITSDEPLPVITRVDVDSQEEDGVE